MLEHCVCCQSPAPAWEDPDYAEWHVVVDAKGRYLGVVCLGCHIDDELALLGFPAPDAPADQLRRRRSARRRAASTRAPGRAAA